MQDRSHEKHEEHHRNWRWGNTSLSGWARVQATKPVHRDQGGGHSEAPSCLRPPPSPRPTLSQACVLRPAARGLGLDLLPSGPPGPWADTGPAAPSTPASCLHCPLETLSGATGAELWPEAAWGASGCGCGLTTVRGVGSTPAGRRDPVERPPWRGPLAGQDLTLAGQGGLSPMAPASMNLVSGGPRPGNSCRSLPEATHSHLCPSRRPEAGGWSSRVCPGPAV